MRTPLPPAEAVAGAPDAASREPAAGRAGRGPLRVLLTGANGYIGMRLLPLLLAAGHQVHCVVRDPQRFAVAHNPERGVWVRQADLLEPLGAADLPVRRRRLQPQLARARPVGVGPGAGGLPRHPPRRAARLAR